MSELILKILAAGAVGIILGLAIVVLIALAIGYLWFGRPIRMSRKERQRVIVETHERRHRETVERIANESQQEQSF